MDATSAFLIVTGSLFCLSLALLIVLWMQWLRAAQYKAELAVLRDLLEGLGAIIWRLETENAELAAGLRAETGQVELLKRQLGQLR